MLVRLLLAILRSSSLPIIKLLMSFVISKQSFTSQPQQTNDRNNLTSSVYAGKN